MLLLLCLYQNLVCYYYERCWYVNIPGNYTKSMRKILKNELFVQKSDLTWEQREFDEVFVEKRDKTERENEDTLLSCAINGIYLNSELFGHFRGATTIGYLKVNKCETKINQNV